MTQVGAPAGLHVVEADNLVALRQESVAQMRSDETCAAGDKDRAAATLRHTLKIPYLPRTPQLLLRS
jgi:hypothetical protein